MENTFKTAGGELHLISLTHYYAFFKENANYGEDASTKLPLNVFFSFFIQVELITQKSYFSPYHSTLQQSRAVLFVFHASLTSGKVQSSF